MFPQKVLIIFKGKRKQITKLLYFSVRYTHLLLQNQLTSREQIPGNGLRPSFQIHSISSLRSELIKQKQFWGKIDTQAAF